MKKEQTIVVLRVEELQVPRGGQRCESFHFEVQCGLKLGHTDSHCGRSDSGALWVWGKPVSYGE